MSNFNWQSILRQKRFIAQKRLTNNVEDMVIADHEELHLYMQLLQIVIENKKRLIPSIDDSQFAFKCSVDLTDSHNNITTLIKNSIPQCTECGTTNEYQSGPFVCYSCRS